jgi:H+-transporting ATPase
VSVCDPTNSHSLLLDRLVCLFRADDAPSLKKADCGIAVEGASDAARTAADVVFLDEGLSTIITSIKVARQIFHREQLDTISLVTADRESMAGMKAYIIYRIALCIHLEVYLVGLVLLWYHLFGLLMKHD